MLDLIMLALGPGFFALPMGSANDIEGRLA
jgi:hypothetical protein